MDKQIPKQVNFTVEELNFLRSIARQLGLATSSYIRNASLTKARVDLNELRQLNVKETSMTNT